MALLTTRDSAAMDPKNALVVAHFGPISVVASIGGISICKKVLSKKSSSTVLFGAFSAEKGDVDAGSTCCGPRSGMECALPRGPSTEDPEDFGPRDSW